MDQSVITELKRALADAESNGEHQRAAELRIAIDAERGIEHAVETAAETAAAPKRPQRRSLTGRRS